MSTICGPASRAGGSDAGTCNKDLSCGHVADMSTICGPASAVPAVMCRDTTKAWSNEWVRAGGSAGTIWSIYCIEYLPTYTILLMNLVPNLEGHVAWCSDVPRLGHGLTELGTLTVQTTNYDVCCLIYGEHVRFRNKPRCLIPYGRIHESCLNLNTVYGAHKL